MTRPDRRDSRTLRESSTAVHAGNLPDPTTGAIKTPLTLANSYEFPYDPTSIDWSVNDQLLYTRVSGTNQLGLQAKLAALEGAVQQLDLEFSELALALPSGVKILSGVTGRLAPGHVTAIMVGRPL